MPRTAGSIPSDRRVAAKDGESRVRPRDEAVGRKIRVRRYGVRKPVGPPYGKAREEKDWTVVGKWEG